MPGIKDVALKAGVSISTVSRVMNNTKNVSPELAKKVQDAVTELEYSANLAAHSLRSIRSRLIAVIVTSFSRPFFTGILEGINAIAAETGYTVLLAETHDNLTDEVKLVSEFEARCVDGIILASSAYGKDRYTQNYIQSLSRLEKKGQKIPVVTLEYAFSNTDISAVVVNNEKSAYDAVTYLIQELGRKDVIHISLPRQHFLGLQRVEGYKRALRNAGIPVRKKYIREGDYSTYSGYRITNELLQSKEKFDAIFCANDQMAVGAVLACNEHNVSVPDEIAIVGNDDIFAASLVRPSLTSIRVPQYEIGTSAMKVLLKHLEEADVGRQIVTLDTQIIKRGTTVKDYQNDLKNLIW